MKNLYRKLRLITFMCQTGFWIDRLWQQLQWHGLLPSQADPDLDVSW